MKEFDNYQGNPRVFSAAFAKDVVAEKIKKGEYNTIIKNREGAMAADFNFWADHIFDWIKQDQQLPMTDDQYIYLENLLEEKTNLNPELEKTIRANLMAYTVAEASKVIAMILDPQLPIEYTDNLVKQRHIMQATADRARRDE